MGYHSSPEIVKYSSLGRTLRFLATFRYSSCSIAAALPFAPVLTLHMAARSSLLKQKLILTSALKSLQWFPISLGVKVEILTSDYKAPAWSGLLHGSRPWPLHPSTEPSYFPCTSGHSPAQTQGLCMWLTASWVVLSQDTCTAHSFTSFGLFWKLTLSERSSLTI